MAAYQAQWADLTPVTDLIEALLETTLARAKIRARVRNVGTHIEVRAAGDEQDQLRALMLVEHTLHAARIKRDVYGVVQ